MHKYTRLILACGLLLSGPGASYGMRIGFDADQGYSPTGSNFGNGNLVGQPAFSGVTAWQGSTSAGTDEIRVRPGGTSDQCLQTYNGSTAAPFYKYAPTAADLGGVFDPNSSVLAYSFKLRLDQAPLSTVGSVLRPRLGEDGSGNPVTNFELLSNGKFYYNDAAANLTVKTTSGGPTDFVAPTGTYFTVSGVVDYGRNVYLLYINGVAQLGSSGQAWLGIRSLGGKTPNFTLRELSSGSAVYRQVSIDDLYLALNGRSTPRLARRADEFVNAIGLNTHLGNTDIAGGSTYANPNTDVLLANLGVRHIRENAGPNQPWARLLPLYQNYGITVDLIGRYTNSTSYYAGLVSAYPFFELFEGLNEPDHPKANYSYNGIFDDKPAHNYAGTLEFQNSLVYDINHVNLNISHPQILSPALAFTGNSYFVAPINADYLSLHSYADGYLPTHSQLDATKMPSLLRMAGSGVVKPFMVTETGYHTSENYKGASLFVSPEVQGKYLVRSLAEYFNRGSNLTYIYELMDSQPDDADKEANFGIVFTNFQPKPSYTAIKNLITLLSEATWNPNNHAWECDVFTPQTLDYTLTGNTKSVHQTLLQKANGDYYLLLWQEVPAYFPGNKLVWDEYSDAAVTLRLNTPIQRAETYLLDSLTAKTVTNAPTDLNLNVPDQVMVVKLTPANIAAPWKAMDIGATLAGKSTIAGTNATVSGAGADIWNTADQFQYLSQPLTGDGEITVKVVSQGNTNSWAKAGLMMRESTAAGSRFANIFVTPAQGIVAQYRGGTGQAALQHASVTGGAPSWLRLRRQGNSFTASYSSNGTNWTQLGNVPMSVTMSSTIQVGLAVTSHDANLLSQVQFTDLSLTGSPVVNVAALQSQAGVAPVQPGLFRISRQGNLASALTVGYSVDGSATAGTHYQALSGSVVIPANAAYADVQVNPLTVANQQGTRSLRLKLNSSANYNIGAAGFDAINVNSANPLIADFYAASPTPPSGWTSGARSFTSTVANADGGYALKWEFDDTGDTWNNELRLSFPAPQNWTSARRLVIHFREDPANPLTDIGCRMFMEIINNGVRDSHLAPTATWNLTRETNFHTVSLDLGDLVHRDLVTQVTLSLNGNELVDQKHYWYIDSITME